MCKYETQTWIAWKSALPGSTGMIWPFATIAVAADWGRRRVEENNNCDYIAF